MPAPHLFIPCFVVFGGGTMGARRVLVCTMLEKPGKRAVAIEADFVGFACPDVFVVGYGMDVAHSYRELPFIGLVVTARDAA